MIEEPKVPSAAWADALRDGELLPVGMRACPACGTATPPVAFVAGVCLDCAISPPQVDRRRRIVGSFASPSAPTAAPLWAPIADLAQERPELFTVAMTHLTACEAAVLTDVLRGRSVKAIAKERKIAASTARGAIKRAFKHFTAIGWLGLKRSPVESDG